AKRFTATNHRGWERAAAAKFQRANSEHPSGTRMEAARRGNETTRNRHWMARLRRASKEHPRLERSCGAHPEIVKRIRSRHLRTLRKSRPPVTMLAFGCPENPHSHVRRMRILPIMSFVYALVPCVR